MDMDGRGEMNRREFLVWAGAVAAMLALPGCDPFVDAASAPPARPARRIQPRTAYASPVGHAVAAPQMVQPVQYVVAQQPAAVRFQHRQGGGKVSAMSRNSWGAKAPITAKMRPMNGVTRITVHHEGTPKGNNDVTPAQVASSLRDIQVQHYKRMGAGDIGYHFIIDRGGSIWQGRDWAYQGAHASGANSNNLGVMLLGNFEFQQPTAQQLMALNNLTASLVRKFGLNPRTDIYGHSDFCNTQCPGRNLKPQVAVLRSTLRA